MKHLVFVLFLVSTAGFSASAQVIGDECPCDEQWGRRLINESDYRQVVLEAVSTLNCELPYSRELSENPVGLLRSFMDNPHGQRAAFDEFIYGFEQIVRYGTREGYLDDSCTEGLRVVKAHLEKLAKATEE